MRGLDSTLGPTASKTSLKSLEGMGPVKQFVGLRCMTTSVSVDGDTGSNCLRVGRLPEGRLPVSKGALVESKSHAQKECLHTLHLNS